MYIIKRGDEVLFRTESLSQICVYPSLFLPDTYNNFSDLEKAHFRLAYIASTYSDFPRQYILNGSLIPIAAKYGLTIEEVKDV